MATKEQVEQYYDSFKEHQKKLGINIRHRTILKNLKKAGLRPDSNVMEVGCGIGTVSHLILKYITEGSFVGVDISPESIAMAKKLNSFHKKAEFLVNDMSEFSHATKFDFFVFPDVLEHIPVEQHNNLFKNVAKAAAPDATILINIPEPNYLNWVRAHQPEKLQIIDQSLSMQDLLNNIYPHGFKLQSLNPYSLHFNVDDYVSIVMKNNMAVNNVEVKNKLSRVIDNTISKIG